MPAKNDTVVSAINTLPGVKRDGTELDGNFYADALWCRFRNGRPKKVGGFREIVNLSTVTVPTNGPSTPIRELFVVPSSPLYLIYAFHGNGVTGVAVDQNGLGASTFDRTPAGFAAADQWKWQVDSLYDSIGGATRILAHAGKNLVNIAEETAYPIYYGTGTDQAAVLTSTGVSVSGGVCVLQPFTFAYGSNGLIKNSDANKPNVYTGGLSNEVNVAGTKIVKGMSLRGGAASPAGLFWALDALIRVSFIGGTTLWRYDTISDEISVLSSSGMVEYDGVYYWPGVDRFLMYDGVVKEIPNPFNQDYFFDNLNFDQRQKVFGLKIARWGEIWWFFPSGTATECNHAVIYNVREKVWYDTPVYRSAGYPAREMYFPIMADSASNTDSTGSVVGYRLFRHEVGVDSVIGEDQVAIPSYFETSDIGLAAGPNPENPNVMTKISRVEPDLKQVGEMSVTLTGESFPQSTPVDIAPVTFQDTDGKVDLRGQKRIMRLRFESNVAGGNYHCGKNLVHLEPGDDRPGDA